jgi:hypothetical protein
MGARSPVPPPPQSNALVIMKIPFSLGFVRAEVGAKYY